MNIYYKVIRNGVEFYDGRRLLAVDSGVAVLEEDFAAPSWYTENSPSFQDGKFFGNLCGLLEENDKEKVGEVKKSISALLKQIPSSERSVSAARKPIVSALVFHSDVNAADYNE